MQQQPTAPKQPRVWKDALYSALRVLDNEWEWDPFVTGSGSYGIVVCGKSRTTGERVAAKLLKEVGETAAMVNALRELRALLALPRHVNVVDTLRVAMTVEAAVVVVMPAYDLTVRRLMRSTPGHLPVSSVLTIFASMAHALADRHGRGFVHRDVKPDNMLLSRCRYPALGDWGLARDGLGSCQDELTGEIVSIWYAPPEVLMSTRSYTSSVDVWSLGMVLLEMLMAPQARAACGLFSTSHVGTADNPRMRLEYFVHVTLPEMGAPALGTSAHTYLSRMYSHTASQLSRSRRGGTKRSASMMVAAATTTGSGSPADPQPLHVLPILPSPPQPAASASAMDMATLPPTVSTAVRHYVARYRNDVPIDVLIMLSQMLAYVPDQRLRMADVCEVPSVQAAYVATTPASLADAVTAVLKLDAAKPKTVPVTPVRPSALPGVHAGGGGGDGSRANLQRDAPGGPGGAVGADGGVALVISASSTSISSSSSTATSTSSTSGESSKVLNIRDHIAAARNVRLCANITPAVPDTTAVCTFSDVFCRRRLRDAWAIARMDPAPHEAWLITMGMSNRTGHLLASVPLIDLVGCMFSLAYMAFHGRACMTRFTSGQSRDEADMMLVGKVLTAVGGAPPLIPAWAQGRVALSVACELTLLPSTAGSGCLTPSFMHAACTTWGPSLYSAQKLVRQYIADATATATVEPPSRVVPPASNAGGTVFSEPRPRAYGKDTPRRCVTTTLAASAKSLVSSSASLSSSCVLL